MKTFKLDNGKYLTQDFGKYRSGLLIITDKEPFNRPFEVVDGDVKEFACKVVKFKYVNGKTSLASYNVIEEDFGEETGLFYEKVAIGEYDTTRAASMEYYKKEAEKNNNPIVGYEVVKEMPLYRFKTKSLSEPTDKYKKMNIPYEGSLVKVIKGQFRINKKGSKIFDTTRRGDLMLIIDWGGAFEKSRGIDIDKVKDYKYYRHASSNGGGTGYDYLVVKEGYFNILSEDDF